MHAHFDTWGGFDPLPISYRLAGGVLSDRECGYAGPSMILIEESCPQVTQSPPAAVGLRVSYRAGALPSTGTVDGSSMAASADGIYRLHVPLAFEGPPSAAAPATNGRGGVGRIFVSIENLLPLIGGGGSGGYTAILLVTSKPPGPDAASAAGEIKVPICGPGDQISAGTLCSPVATELSIGGTVWGSVPSGGWRYFVFMERHSFLQLQVKTLSVQRSLKLTSRIDFFIYLLPQYRDCFLQFHSSNP